MSQHGQEARAYRCCLLACRAWRTYVTADSLPPAISSLIRKFHRGACTLTSCPSADCTANSHLISAQLHKPSSVLVRVSTTICREQLHVCTLLQARRVVAIYGWPVVSEIRMRDELDCLLPGKLNRFIGASKSGSASLAVAIYPSVGLWVDIGVEVLFGWIQS